MSHGNSAVTSISAARVQRLAGGLVEQYGGDAERVWSNATDSAELRRRISTLPGFGNMKAIALGSVLAKRFGVEAAQGLVPDHPTLGDVDSVEALEDYQAKKRAYKASLKAKGVSGAAGARLRDPRPAGS